MSTKLFSFLGSLIPPCSQKDVHTTELIKKARIADKMVDEDEDLYFNHVDPCLEPTRTQENRSNCKVVAP